MNTPPPDTTEVTLRYLIEHPNATVQMLTDHIRAVHPDHGHIAVKTAVELHEQLVALKHPDQSITSSDISTELLEFLATRQRRSKKSPAPAAQQPKGEPHGPRL